MSLARPRPAQFGASFASMFELPDVAKSYAARPPYPPALFDVLDRLADPTCRIVLDAGAGTGDLARPLSGRLERVDAVDPSVAMVEAGMRCPGGRGERLRWILGTAESAPLDPPYGLVVAGQSLAWMEWDVVLPRWRSVMTPAAVVAVVERTWDGAPWRERLRPVVARWSTNREWQPFDLLAELADRRLFRVLGHEDVDGDVEVGIETVIDGLHSQNGLSRDRLGARASAAFDDEARTALVEFASDGRLRVPAGAQVTWGVPT